MPTSDEGETQLPDFGDSIDSATFEQILEMDDDEDREFSRSIVYGFFDQAGNTFSEMEQRLQDEDLKALSELGHFLKGSSATLGLTLIKQSCEKIQHWGKYTDATGDKPEDGDKCLQYIESELAKLRKEYAHVETALKRFYGEKV